jgi:hypothetical protein
MRLECSSLHHWTRGIAELKRSRNASTLERRVPVEHRLTWRTAWRTASRTPTRATNPDERHEPPPMHDTEFTVPELLSEARFEIRINPDRPKKTRADPRRFGDP